jgi:RNA polymerase sigma factor (sigma-70 family)
MDRVIQHLRRAALSHGDGPTDGQLLGAYLDERDEVAFEALVRRHGPMVLGVCRRVLCHTQDAEDAFQATFLVLVRKGHTIRPREMVGSWLFGVAYRAALKARAENHRRRGRERLPGSVPERGALDPVPAEPCPRLDQELSRLPERYRAVLLLCDMDGKTREEAARLLGWPAGTVASRLARGRALLARRLGGNGKDLTLSPVALGLPPALVAATMRAAGGLVPAPVVTLIEGVLRTMLYAKLRPALVVVILLALLGTGLGLLRPAQSAEDRTVAPQVARAVTVPEKKGAMAWGPVVNGLQVGVGFPAGAPRSYRIGEWVGPVVKLRNVSDQPIDYAHVVDPFSHHPPVVEDQTGKRGGVEMPPRLGFNVPLVEGTLKPGEEIELSGLVQRPPALMPILALPIGRPVLQLEPPERFGAPLVPSLRRSPGKYTIQYEGLLSSHPLLSTGKIEIEVTAPR